MKSIFILLFAAVCCQATYAQKGAKIPEQVKAAFAKSYTSAKKVKWDKEDDQYEASFTSNSHKMSVLYTATGSVVETETEMAVADLPKPAQKYAAAKGKIKGAAKIVKADGGVLYEAELKGKDLLFNEKGDFVTEKQEKD